MWGESPRKFYFMVLEEFKHRVIIELAGHDHFASLRSHKIDSNDFFHNLLVAPSITPWYKNNPGVSSLAIDNNLLPCKLRTTFLNLRPTIGKEEVTAFEDLEFRELDFERQWSIKDLTAESIWDFA